MTLDGVEEGEGVRGPTSKDRDDEWSKAELLLFRVGSMF